MFDPFEAPVIRATQIWQTSTDRLVPKDPTPTDWRCAAHLTFGLRLCLSSGRTSDDSITQWTVDWVPTPA